MGQHHVRVLAKGPYGWLNPDVKPLPYDIDKANEILDGLGYTRGSDGIRVAPADQRPDAAASIR